MQKELIKLQPFLENLEKSDDYLIISDFDDTIFSTKEDLEKNIRNGNRGIEGNKYIKKIIGIDKYIKDFYLNKDYPKTITSKLRVNKDLILTAGFKEIQTAKIKATKLEHINLRVVSESSEKPLALIKYIILELKYIPKKIIIYEDRPDCFLETKKIIENFLKTNIEIFFVQMNGNNKKIKLKKI